MTKIQDRAAVQHTRRQGGQRSLLLGLCAVCAVLLAPWLNAQELVPRAYWPAPVGTNVIVLGYQHSSGDVVVDPSLPVTGVDSSIDYFQASYVHSFALAGRTATGSITQAVADGTTDGVFEAQPFSRRTVGAGDTVARLAVNIAGAPAMDRREFSELRRNPRTIVGASLTVSAPTGQYNEDRVINLGTNRWTIQPALGVIYPLSPSLLLEFESGVRFFQDNDEFLGVTRQQDPVLSAQVHLIKRFRPGFWAALDANFYAGGRTRVDGDRNRDLQRNSRFGGTLVYPIMPGHAVRLGMSIGTVTETGGDYDLVSLAWIHAF
jgi:hypothetical protein